MLKDILYKCKDIKYKYVVHLFNNILTFTHLSSLVKPYALKKMGLSVNSLSARFPREVMSEVVALGGNPISLHCLKLVVTSLGFARLAGM